MTNLLKSKKNITFIIILSLLFIYIRFLVSGLMYHQDEYKWAMIVNGAFNLDLKSDHPPLIGILYKFTGEMVGYDNLRVLPIIVSLFCLALLYLLMYKFYGKREAIVSSILYTFSIYALIANTQIDIDGALLPFATLITFYSYFSIQRDERIRFWSPVFVGSVILGFMIKLSFIIVMGTILTDFLMRHKLNWGFIRKALITVFSSLAFIVGVTLGFVFLFDINNPLQFVKNVSHFGVFNFSERNYFQVLFLTVKSIIFASPFILLPLFLAFSKRFRKDMSIWFLYLLYSIIFYYFIFDFSNRTIERYNMFVILPIVIIGGVFLAENLRSTILKKKELIVSCVIGLLAFAITLSLVPLDSKPLPLNPKSVYIDNITKLNFDFLLPLTGGSGPIGFYVSVYFVFVLFLICTLLLGLCLRVSNRRYALYMLVGFVSFALSYNLVLGREFITGSIYGNVDTVAKDVTSYTNSHPDIQQVITYYDIAGYELNSTGKYFKRFYTDPMFEKTNVTKFNSYAGYYMVVDFPEINKNSVYWKYLESCKRVFETRNKNISGYVFDCRDGNSNLFK